MRSTQLLAIYAATISTIALGLVLYNQFWRTSLSLEHIAVEKLTAGSISVEYHGRELARISDSSVSGGGALVLFNSEGQQALIATDGTLAFKGVEPKMQANLHNSLRGWPLVLMATTDSSTLAMKGENNYELVLQAGKTLDDPLAIRGGRIEIRSEQTASKLDASGVKQITPRNW